MTPIDTLIETLEESRPDPLPFWDVNDQKTAFLALLKTQMNGTNLITRLLEDSVQTHFFTDLIASCANYTNFKSRKRAEILNIRKQETIHITEWWEARLKNKTDHRVPSVRELLNQIEKNSVENNEVRWLICLHESKPSIYEKTSEDSRNQPPALITALDRYLGFAVPANPHHESGRQALGFLDFPEFRSVLIELLQLAENIAARLTKVFPNAKPSMKLMWLLRAYVEESTRNLSALGDLKEEFQLAQEGLFEAYQAEDDFKKKSTQDGPIDFYWRPFGDLIEFETTLDPRHTYLASRIALAALAYSESKDTVKWVLEILWQVRVKSDKVREPENYDENLDAKLQQLFTQTLVANNSPRKPSAGGIYKSEKAPSFYLEFTTEYNNAEQWLNDPGKKGSLIKVANQHLNGPRKTDHEFVRAVLERLLISDTFNKHAVVAIASKLAVFYKGIPEPRCSIPYSPTLKTAAGYMVKRIGRLTEAIAGPARSTKLFKFAESIYPTADCLNKDGFSWETDSPSRRGRTSDAHIEHPENIGSHLWLLGTKFQAVVDDVIDKLGACKSSPDRPYNGKGDLFSRFVFLVPLSEELSRQHGGDLLSDWPGTIPLRLALREAAHFKNDSIDLGKALFLPITSKRAECAVLGPYFERIKN